MDDVPHHDHVDDALRHDSAHRDVLHRGQALHDDHDHDHARRDVHLHDNALLRHDHVLHRDALCHDRAGRGVPQHAVEDNDFRGETFSQVLLDQRLEYWNLEDDQFVEGRWYIYIVSLDRDHR